MDLLKSSHTNQCQLYYTLEGPLPLGDLRLNAFSHPWIGQNSYVFPPSTLGLLVLSRFLAEHATGKMRLLALVAPFWMEAPWLPTGLNILKDIPHQFTIARILVFKL